MSTHRRSFLLGSAGAAAGLLWPGARARAAMDGVCLDAAGLNKVAGDPEHVQAGYCLPTLPAFKKPKYLLVVIAKGGWDPSFAFDPKTGNEYVDGPEVDLTEAPGDVETTIGFGRDGVGDDTLASPGAGMILKANPLKRPSVTRFFENWWPITAVVNGQWTGSIVHQPCRIRLLTGTTDSFNPDFATIFGFEKGTGLPLGSIDFSGLSYSGQLAASTGRIGFNSQLKTLLDPNTYYPAPKDAPYAIPSFRRDTDAVGDSEEDRLVRAILDQRIEEMRGKFGDYGPNGQKLDDMIQAMDRRKLLLAQGSSIVEDLIIGEEPDMYLQACVAVDLLEKGLCRAVTLQHFDSWDTHKANVLQHERFESFFDTLDLLLCRLNETNLLAETMVVVCSEMGRTPRLNVGFGKDHWAHTTQLVIGAGVKGGWTYGGTSDAVESMSVDLASGELQDAANGGELLKYDNFVSGLLQMCEIDPAKWLPLAFPFVGAMSS